ncbi:MAG: hypothetical protein K2N37_09780 [Lachnospiraceae bacterium]|nr:hypothetical protein [Lachnospiraceae bacterium]
MIVSHRTPEELLARLRSVTALYESFLVPLDEDKKMDPDFKGEIGETGFKIRPRIGTFVLFGMNAELKNSFLPMIVGRIHQANGQTTVEIKMRLMWHIFLFLVIWFAGTGVAFLAGLLAAITDSGIESAAVPAVMFLSGQVLMRVGFYPAAKIARQKLETLFRM